MSNREEDPIGLIDIGGTKIMVGVVEEGSHRPIWDVQPTSHADPIDQLSTMLDELCGAHALSAIAMAVPGPFSKQPPGLKQPPNQPACWWDLDFRATLGSRYGCPIYIENDANCAALAETHWGASTGFGTVVYYTVSTGIGCGLVRDGRLVSGSHDTEGGHQIVWPRHLPGSPLCHCGAHGCLEALASGMSLKQRFGRKPEDIQDQAIWDEVGGWLGIAVANSKALTDCDIVVFGGGVCGKWARFESALRRTAHDSIRLHTVPEIRLAELGPERNLLGAMFLVESVRARMEE